VQSQLRRRASANMELFKEIVENHGVSYPTEMCFLVIKGLGYGLEPFWTLSKFDFCFYLNLDNYIKKYCFK
jgi:hypothetical protein